ncbi:hypothetical protein QL285_083226 [Trifolium repens]|nr:hypothetical protein QL285_083226 [Trifolium repens]
MIPICVGLFVSPFSEFVGYTVTPPVHPFQSDPLTIPHPFPTFGRDFAPISSRVSALVHCIYDNFSVHFNHRVLQIPTVNEFHSLL